MIIFGMEATINLIKVLKGETGVRTRSKVIKAFFKLHMSEYGPRIIQLFNEKLIMVL